MGGGTMKLSEMEAPPVTVLARFRPIFLKTGVGFDAGEWNDVLVLTFLRLSGLSIAN